MDEVKGWFKSQKRKKNPLDKFVISEGEFVKIKSGVTQLPVEELKEKEGAEEDDNTSNKDTVARRQ